MIPSPLTLLLPFYKIYSCIIGLCLWVWDRLEGGQESEVSLLFFLGNKIQSSGRQGDGLSTSTSWFLLGLSHPILKPMLTTSPPCWARKGWKQVFVLPAKRSVPPRCYTLFSPSNLKHSWLGLGLRDLASVSTGRNRVFWSLGKNLAQDGNLLSPLILVPLSLISRAFCECLWVENVPCSGLAFCTWVHGWSPW